MKFLLPIMMTAPGQYIPLARAAEEHGYDGVVLADSICFPEHSDTAYPHTKDGSRRFLEGKPFVEPLVAMSAMGAVTDRLTFYTAVLKLPVRQPVILAKQLTSLAALVGDRVRLGVGLSPWPEDFDVAGVPWRRRGARMDEAIGILRGLMTGEYFGWEGEHFTLPRIKMNPAPAVPVPILIGGHSEAAFERAARTGDGWISVGGKPDELCPIVERIARRRGELGRTGRFEFVAAGRATATPEGVRALAEAGATHVIADFSARKVYDEGGRPASLDENLADLVRYADEIIKGFRPDPPAASGAAPSTPPGVPPTEHERARRLN